MNEIKVEHAYPLAKTIRRKKDICDSCQGVQHHKPRSINQIINRQMAINHGYEASNGYLIKHHAY